MRFSARVVRGRGEAAGFTGLPWVRDRFLQRLGIDPYPGTLNLEPVTESDGRCWRDLAASTGIPIEPPDGSCASRAFRVRVSDRVPGAIILPDVPGYPADQIEVVSALCLRDGLSLGDGDRIEIVVTQPLAVRAVIFDVDGTLIDSLPAFRVVAELAAAPRGLQVTDAVVRQALNTGRSFWDLIVPPDWDARTDVMRELSRDAGRQWPSVLAEHGCVIPDVGPVVDALRARGLKLGIVTGARRPSLEPLRARGLLDRFDVVIGREDVVAPKPDPEGLLQCLAALRVTPDAAIYVGDTQIDADAARAAGVRMVAVLTGAADSHQLAACGPEYVLSSIADLPGIVVTA